MERGRVVIQVILDHEDAVVHLLYALLRRACAPLRHIMWFRTDARAILDPWRALLEHALGLPQHELVLQRHLVVRQ